MEVKIKEGGLISDKPASRFEVTLLQEGLGNFGNCFYYTKEALISAVPLFEGEQAMRNHLTESEEQEQPEGSVDSLGGYYQGLKVVEADGGRHELQGVLVVPVGVQFDKARDLMQAATEYAKQFSEKDFIGLSINASGDADEKSIDEVIASAPEACKPKLLEAKEKGIDTVKVTKQITAVSSCDLVTKAGAGGKVLKLLESAKKEREMKVKKKEGADGAAGADDAGHDDAPKDKALIKSMLDKHVGKDKHDDKDAEECEAMMGAYTELGHKGEEAAMMAAKHVAVAKQMKQKKEADEKAAAEAEGEEEAEEAEDAGEKKEAVVKLAAENSALKERIGKLELSLHVDKKLSESGLSPKMLKAVRESAKDCKSVKDFERTLKIFVEAKKVAGEGGEVYAAAGKEETQGNGSGEGVSFADAAEED